MTITVNNPNWKYIAPLWEKQGVFRKLFRLHDTILNDPDVQKGRWIIIGSRIESLASIVKKAGVAEFNSNQLATILCCGLSIISWMDEKELTSPEAQLNTSYSDLCDSIKSTIQSFNDPGGMLTVYADTAYLIRLASAGLALDHKSVTTVILSNIRGILNSPKLDPHREEWNSLISQLNPNGDGCGTTSITIPFTEMPDYIQRIFKEAHLSYRSGITHSTRDGNFSGSPVKELQVSALRAAETVLYVQSHGKLPNDKVCVHWDHLNKTLTFY